MCYDCISSAIGKFHDMDKSIGFFKYLILPKRCTFLFAQMLYTLHISVRSAVSILSASAHTFLERFLAVAKVFGLLHILVPWSTLFRATPFMKRQIIYHYKKELHSETVATLLCFPPYLYFIDLGNTLLNFFISFAGCRGLGKNVTFSITWIFYLTQYLSAWTPPTTSLPVIMPGIICFWNMFQF